MKQSTPSQPESKGQTPKYSKQERKKRNRKKKMISLFVFVAVVVLLIAGLFLWIDSYMEEKIGMINIQTEEEDAVFVTEPLTEIVLPETFELPDNHGVLNEDEIPLIHQEVDSKA